jgi:CPA2 family monovalent cation:H+ antiporter-2
MLIEPALVVRHGAAIAEFTALVIVGKIVGVGIGAFVTGNGVRTSVQAGMSLAQIGEFSFIIAGLGVSLGATRDFLYPVAVTVSAITTLTTPWLIRASGPAATLIERKLPCRLWLLAAFYGSWVEQVRTSSQRRSVRAGARRIVRVLVLDAVLLGTPPCARRHPPAGRRPLRGAAVALLEIAVTQPFVPGAPGAVVLLILLVVLGLAAWRSATQLQGHVRAGAQVIVEALARSGGATSPPQGDALAEMRALLPGLGEPVVVRLHDGSPGVGRTLAALVLQDLTGATVLAISRPGGGVQVPNPHEVLRAGDVLAIAGTREAVSAGRALLEPEPVPKT